MAPNSDDQPRGCPSRFTEFERYPALVDENPKNPEVSALVRLYLERRAKLIRFFAARTGSAAEAQDLVQEMYLKIAGIDADGITNPVGYLYQLGTNLWLDRHRSRSRSARRDHEYHEAHRSGVAAEETYDAPSAEDLVDSRQRLRLMMAAIEQLPPQCRRVFELHKIEGLSHAQVAEKLGIARSTVEKHVIAAFRHLSKRLT